MNKSRQILTTRKHCIDSSNYVKVKIASTTSGNIATGYGVTWESALRNAIDHYKKQYGHSKNLAILINE